MLSFGKLAPAFDYRTPRLASYLRTGSSPADSLPPLPDTWSVLGTLAIRLGIDITGPDAIAALFPIDWNDVYGDCTIAALAHARTVYRGLVGEQIVMPAEEVLAIYFALGNNLDAGLAESRVLSWWKGNSIYGERLLSEAVIDPKNHDHVKYAMTLFGGVYLGFQVQQDAIADFQAIPRRPWTPGPLLQEGHAVFAVAYGPDGVDVLTWGGIQHGTWAWWDACVDEAYALLPAEASNPGFAPGFDSAQLMLDLAKIGSVQG